jgi:hypothetical protein
LPNNPLHHAATDRTTLTAANELCFIRAIREIRGSYVFRLAFLLHLSIAATNPERSFSEARPPRDTAHQSAPKLTFFMMRAPSRTGAQRRSRSPASFCNVLHHFRAFSCCTSFADLPPSGRTISELRRARDS